MNARSGCEATFESPSRPRVFAANVIICSFDTSVEKEEVLRSAHEKAARIEKFHRRESRRTMPDTDIR